MSGNSPLAGGHSTSLANIGDRIKSKFSSGPPGANSGPASRAASVSSDADFNIKFVAADDELDIDDILAAATQRRKDAAAASAAPHNNGLTDREDLRCENASKANNDPGSKLAFEGSTKGSAKPSASTPLPISPELTRQSEDKMKRNIMKVIDFQANKTRSLDLPSISKFKATEPGVDDAMESAASASSMASSAIDFDEAGDAVSPSRKSLGFFDDLQSKIHQKSKDLQLSSPVATRNIIGDLQHRWAQRGSREPTPTPDSASPDGSAPSSSPPTTKTGAKILVEIKEMLHEKKGKLEEEMNKRKAFRSGAAIPTPSTVHSDDGRVVAVEEITVHQGIVKGRSSPVVVPPGRASPSEPRGSASRGQSPSLPRAKENYSAPFSGSPFTGRSFTGSVRIDEGDSQSYASSNLPPALTAQEVHEDLITEDESDAPPQPEPPRQSSRPRQTPITAQTDNALLNSAARDDSFVSHSINQNSIPGSPSSGDGIRSSMLADKSSTPPPTPPPPLRLPLPRLFSDLKFIHQLVFVVAILASLVALPLPSFVAGAIFGAVVVTAFWSLIMLIASSFRTVKPEEGRKKDKVLTFDPPLPFVHSPTFPRHPSATPTVHVGWVNLLPFPYEPVTYHVAQTYSVLASLDSTSGVLILRRPRLNVPKRAMRNEVLPTDAAFTEVREYRLDHSASIRLLPLGLVSKRLFSKKYPISIELGDDVEEDNDGALVGDCAKLRNRLPNANVEKPDDSERDVATDLGYELVSKEILQMKAITLFARSCREKEEWYQKLLEVTKPPPASTSINESAASASCHESPVKRAEPLDFSQPVVFRKAPMFETLERDPSFGEGNFDGTLEDDRIELPSASERDDATDDDFKDYLSRATEAAAGSNPADANGIGSAEVATDADALESESSSFVPAVIPEPAPSTVSPSPPHIWLNALLMRLFWDFLREAKWRRLLMEKVQKKLGKMHLPHFINELQVTEMDLGKALPNISRAGDPYLDDHGLWIKLAVDYRGSAKMTLETKMNLMKLKRASTKTLAGAESAGATPAAEENDLGKKEEKKRSEKLAPLFNEDAEDSAESDSEIEDNDEPIDPSKDDSSQLHLQQPQGTSKKILSFIDKVAATKYFQQATEVKVIKKAMEGVSNTPLILTVCVESLTGTLCLNVPPAPSDRLWWGFLGDPHLKLSVTPRIGDKELTLTQVTDWIEARLKMEFEKILVIPNMDDLIIPLLNPASVHKDT